LASENERIYIAVDAMGGDFAPHEIVKGAIQGARKYNVGLDLVGHPDKIRVELEKHANQGIEIRITEALDEVDMGESPVVALRRKKNASIAVAARQVKQGKAHAMVAAGSTGAAMAAALLNIGRIKGIERPAIGVALPTLRGLPTLMIDGGANMDSEPHLMVQFAALGHAYMQGMHGLPRPKVGLLNVGSEKGKGNTFCKEAFELLEANSAFYFAGNAEGRDFFIGDFDVIVCDGFAGNIALKSAEGMATMFGKLLKSHLMKNGWTKLVGLLAKPMLDKVKHHLDHEYVGGALLLGIDGICVIAHGGSSALAIENAMRVAISGVKGNVLGKMQVVTQESLNASTHVVASGQEAVLTGE
jgi:phosphate acyltransferase